MAEQPCPDDLAQLRATVTALQARLARVERGRRLPRRALPLALVALLVALLPLATFAAGFTDLNAGSPHNDNIAAIAAVGITKGCNPPDYTQYCPNDKVTREEMASFLARTAGLGTNPPVVNAKTAQTAVLATNATHATSADTATTATTATNATTVGGYAPSGLVRAAIGTNPAIVGLTGTYQTLATVTIVAPAAGVVLVDSTLTAGLSGTGTSGAQFRLRDTTSDNVSFVAEAYRVDSGGSILESSLSPTHAFAVSAGGPRTFVLEGRALVGSSSSVFHTITALYVPFGSTGGGTLEVGPSPEPSPAPSGRPVTQP